MQGSLRLDPAGVDSRCWRRFATGSKRASYFGHSPYLAVRDFSGSSVSKGGEVKGMTTGTDINDD